tara:strand:+ start:123 stop:338 length:216 start_codon:yes stop_codon:yes gene_type:complete
MCEGDCECGEASCDADTCRVLCCCWICCGDATYNPSADRKPLRAGDVVDSSKKTVQYLAPADYPNLQMLRT